MIRIAPMTADAYQEWLQQAIYDYAQDKIRAGNWAEATALTRSEKEFDDMLSDGVATPHHFLRTIFIADTNQPVGALWYALSTESSQKAVMIYDFVIDEPYRRRGYALQALAALEQEVAAMGIDEILLHVFGFNHGAQALYAKAGYQITNVRMAKRVGENAH